MRIVTPRKLKEYAEKVPAAKIALLHWHQIVNKSTWHSLADMKNDFRTVDYVGNNRYVFNIKGNQFRIIVLIIFISQKVYIRFIGTHAEYDQIDAKTI